MSHNPRSERINMSPSEEPLVWKMVRKAVEALDRAWEADFDIFSRIGDSVSHKAGESLYSTLSACPYSAD